MNEILTLIIIGIGLSLDAFSVSLGIGNFITSYKKVLVMSFLVGSMHFVMPILGLSLGNKILEIITISSSKILGIILLLLAVEMIYDIFKKETTKFSFNYLSIFIFSLTVSLDSFTTGIGLTAISSNTILACSIFSLLACSFTLIGLLLSKYSSDHLGLFANILGIILLLSLGIKYLFV